MNNVFKKILSIVLSAVMTVSSMTVIGFTPVMAADSDVMIYACEGVQEAAYIEWAAVAGTDHYYVSYAKSGSNDFTQIDDELIRQYPDRWRADLVGLAAGDYTVKVTCKDAGGSTIAESAQDCTVVAQDRTGFTFSPKSLVYDNGGNGAYNADGTLKDGANVLYITDDNFDTVTLDLVNKDGKAYTATGVADILSTMGGAANKGNSNPPLALRFLGTIGENHNSLEKPNILQIKADKGNVKVDITFEGVGEDTIFDGLGLRLNGVANCEIRNIAFYNWHDDAVQIQGNENSNHWIHNNDFFYGENHGGDQAKGDGASDIKDNSKYSTFSYNHYWDSGKTSLCGMKSESGENFISYHHNWFDHSDSRHPRVRTMSVHVYNNYYDGNSKYGVGVSAKSNAFVEGNYFRGCKYPTLQGSVGCDADGNGGSSTLKDDNPIGAIKFVNNFVTGAKDNWKTDTDETSSGNGDACEVDSRSQSLTYTTAAGAKYNNFDTSGEQASYIQSIKIDSPEVARDKAVNYAGRTGNDFLFTFNNAVDDIDYEINTALASAVQTYARDTSDDFISYGGASDGSGPVATTTTTTEATTETPTETTTEEVTEVTTFSDPVEIGEAQTGFTSDSDTDTGTGVSVVFNETTNSWVLTDTSKTAAAELTIPFAEQTSGKIVITGTVQPSTTASKWMFVQIRGTKADGTAGEIIAFGGGADKSDLSVRVNGASTYNKVGSLASKNYNYTIVIDLDNKTADVTIDGVTNSYNLDAASISSLYSTTSKSGSRNVTVSVPYVGVLTDDVPSVSETTTVTEATTETTTDVAESTSETTTEEEPAPDPSDKVYGDVNEDGQLDINDASALIDMVLNGAVEVKDGITDVTDDGKVNSADVAAILQKILDNSWKMPCEPDDEDTTAEVTTDENTSESTTEESTEGTTSEPAPAGSYAHNFTSDGTNSSFFTISGNLSTSKGTVEYNGMTLTQCLKMETATSIKFNAPSAGKLTLVFNSADSKKNCKIDGEKYDSDANGVLTVDLAAGAHEITKRDTSNLFYMVFMPNA